MTSIPKLKHRPDHGFELVSNASVNRGTEATNTSPVSRRPVARGHAHAPLMAPGAGAGAGGAALAPSRGAASFVACSFNLAKAIVGAGMMGLPRAFRLLGWVTGTTLIAAVGGITYWSMAVIVEGDARAGGCASYAALARAACGRRVADAAQVSVLLFCFGFAVVYLVVITDVLVGTPPACNGLICELAGAAAAASPLLSRRAVLLALAGGVAAPLLLIRRLENLDFFNYLGVATSLLLAAISAALGGSALAGGAASQIPAGPQWAALGGGARGAAEVASIVAVLLACYVGHQNLHPLLPLLKPYTGGRMRGVLVVALSIAALVFTVLCVGASLAFGATLQVNVLSNLSIEAMAPLLGRAPATAAGLSIQFGYVISLLASFLLYMHPLRTSVAEMIWPDHEAGAPDHGDGAPGQRGSDGGAEEEAGAGAPGGGGGGGSRAAAMAARHYYALTYSLLAAAALAAVSVPNIWAALSVIGARRGPLRLRCRGGGRAAGADTKSQTRIDHARYQPFLHINHLPPPTPPLSPRQHVCQR
ncbi:MAG: transmembrane amino acid transporter protein-domain-containing protein [Monoraphidium minutum]|nr:MAG: transmembrane amino acid transporter protein-domain-containing protein [Monoraphidium minutum]